ncbi:hypothetical protein LINGRAHAP2_LOCUS24342 [Linum grandiflorum]
MRKLQKALSGSSVHLWNACVERFPNPSSVIIVLLLQHVLGLFFPRRSMVCVHST